MFELSVACKYLIPRRRQLSVSIISLISVLVISLVVWLIVVFFSVTDGLEKSWVQKLTALTAPIRMTPTEAYHHSYYYQVDSISEASGYSLKTIGEKLKAPSTDPYDPSRDEEIPPYWPAPDLDPEGHLKDPVKLVFTALDKMPNVKGLRGQDFELTATHIQLRLLRPTAIPQGGRLYGGTKQSALSYPAFLGTFEGDHRQKNTLLNVDARDLNNLLTILGRAVSKHGGDEENAIVNQRALHARLNFFLTRLPFKNCRQVWQDGRFPVHCFLKRLIGKCVRS